MEKFRGAMILSVVAVVALLLSGCGGGSDEKSDDPMKAPAQAGSGPFFGECGGVTLDEVRKETGFPAINSTVNNASACEWASDDARIGPVASFNWYRGSPISRERATEQLSRDSTKNIDIDGHQGFIASDSGICEVGIDFGADFFEWSVSAGITGAATYSTESLCNAARILSRMSIDRSQK